MHKESRGQDLANLFSPTSMQGFAFMSEESSDTSLLLMVSDPHDQWSWMAGPSSAGNPKAAGEKDA